jgi:hypothetical protein
MPQTPRERAPGTPWIGGWVDLRAVLDTVVKRKIPRQRSKSNMKMDFKQIFGKDVDCIQLTLDRWSSVNMTVKLVTPLEQMKNFQQDDCE